MKKFTLLKSLFVAMVLSLFSFSAIAEEVISNTFSSTTMQTSISAYDKTWDNVSGTTLTLANFNNNQTKWAYVKCGRNGKASVATITTKSALAEKVTKVVVTIDAVTTDKINATYLEVATDAAFTQNVQKTTVTIAKGNLTYTVATPSQNCFYRLTYDCAEGSSNGLVTISKVDFYYTTEGVENIEATAIVLDKTTLSIEQYKTAQLATTLTPANATTLVTWSSSNENVATVVNGLVTAVGVGEATITAKAGELTATCAVTVTEPKAISASEAKAIAETNGSKEVGPYVVCGYVTRIETAYSTQYGNITFWIADFKNGGDVFNLYRVVPVAEVDKAVKVGDYIQAVGTMKLYDSKAQMQPGGKYTIMEDPNPEIEATAIALNKATISLEQYREEKLIATLTHAEATTQIVWTSSNEEIATVTDGLVKAIAIGEATITAKVGEFTATCVVTVSEATVLTCAQAAEMALKATANNVNIDGGQYVVSGYVTEIKDAYSEQYNNISVWVADTKDGGKVLQLYRAKPENNVIPAVGDSIVAIGYLIKYNTTPEMAAGCVCRVIKNDDPTTNVDVTTISNIYTLNRTIVAEGEFEIFTITGQNVTGMNGSLADGVYVVRTATAATKVVIR